MKEKFKNFFKKVYKIVKPIFVILIVIFLVLIAVIGAVKVFNQDDTASADSYNSDYGISEQPSLDYFWEISPLRELTEEQFSYFSSGTTYDIDLDMYVHSTRTNFVYSTYCHFDTLTVGKTANYWIFTFHTTTVNTQNVVIRYIYHNVSTVYYTPQVQMSNMLVFLSPQMVLTSSYDTPQIAKLLWNSALFVELPDIAATARQNGYDAGVIFGEDLGFQNGYSQGYEVGFKEGQAVSPVYSNPVSFFLEPVSLFLGTPLFGSFSIGMALSIVLFVGVALIFIKMFAGG